MRRYLRIIDQPVEVDSGTVSRVAREPFGLEGEALLGAFDHGLDRANFGLADGARCLGVHDDAELHVLAIRLVVHRDMRRYLRIIDQPVEVDSGTVSRSVAKTSPSIRSATFTFVRPV